MAGPEHEAGERRYWFYQDGMFWICRLFRWKVLIDFYGPKSDTKDFLKELRRLNHEAAEEKQRHAEEKQSHDETKGKHVRK
ncbi:hypothetical protein PG984_005248 [Apiospora sp. TS-2023a]